MQTRVISSRPELSNEIFDIAFEGYRDAVHQCPFSSFKEVSQWVKNEIDEFKVKWEKNEFDLSQPFLNLNETFNILTNNIKIRREGEALYDALLESTKLADALITLRLALTNNPSPEGLDLITAEKFRAAVSQCYYKAAQTIQRMLEKIPIQKSPPNTKTEKFFMTEFLNALAEFYLDPTNPAAQQIFSQKIAVMPEYKRGWYDFLELSRKLLTIPLALGQIPFAYSIFCNQAQLIVTFPISFISLLPAMTAAIAGLCIDPTDNELLHANGFHKEVSPLTKFSFYHSNVNLAEVDEEQDNNDLTAYILSRV